MKKSIVFSNKLYKKLFISSTFTSFGDLFDMFAVISLFAYYWKADSLFVTLIPLAYAVPSIIFSQLTGIIADRYNKLNLMIISEVLRALFTFALFFVNEPIIALVILSLRATSSVIKVPSQQAFIREIIAEDQLLQAITLQNITFQIAKVISPFIGATILTFSSPQICILINFIAAIISLLCILLMKKEYVVEKDDLSVYKVTGEKKGIFQEGLLGWKIIINSKVLVLSVVIFHLSYFIVMMVDAQISIFLRDVLPNNPEVLGWLLSGLGLGALFVGIYMNRKEYIKQPLKLVSFGLILLGGALAFISFYNPRVMSHYIILVIAPIGGIGVGLNLLLFNYILQTNTNKDHLGKVYGIINTLTSLVLILAPLLGGASVKLFGAKFTFIFASIITVFVGIASFVIAQFLSKQQNEQIEEQQRNFIS